MTPLLLLLFGPQRPAERTETASIAIAERVAVGAALVTACLILFRQDTSTQHGVHSLFYLPIPILVWAAVRLGPASVFGSGLIVVLLAVWNAAHGRGPFADASQVRCIWDLQAFLLLSLTPIVLLSVVIAERRQTEDELRESEEKYRLLVDHAGDMVVKVDAEGHFLYVSPEYCQVFGKSEDELLGTTFMPLVHADDRAATAQTMEDLQNPPHSCHIEQRAMTRNGWQWIAWRDRAVLDKDGNVEAIVGVGRNIQSLKEAESERKELLVRLGRAEKMEALNLLAGGVAHDLNNILSGIITYPDLLLMDIPENSSLREPLMTIRDSGFRAAAVVKDMVGIARRTDVTRIPGSLSRIVNEYLVSAEHRELMQRFGDTVVISEIDAGLLGMSCSPLHLRKAISNLVLHAVETAGSGGKVGVKTENRYVECAFKAVDEVPAGEYAVLVVTTSGGGVPREDLSRIFEPFYTRKVMGWGGTGLGLTVVYNIVHDHGGSIEVVSNDERTSFALYFPATRLDVPDKVEVESARSYEGDGEHVLVVDDEPAQRDIAQHILQRLMYRVDTVASGAEAVKHLESQPVDLVVLDMIMPDGMGGRETYAMLADLQPGLKAVVASGFAHRDTMLQMREAGVRRYIEKPYTMARLGQAVYEELHGIEPVSL